MANEKDTMNLPQKSSNPGAPAGPSTQPGRGVTSKPTGPEYPDLPPAHTRETPRKVMDDGGAQKGGASKSASSNPPSSGTTGQTGKD